MHLLFAQVRLESGIEDAFARVAAFVPKLAAFLAILVIGYVVAKTIGKIIDKTLERVGFDKAVERGGVRKALAASKYDASDIVSKVVFYTLFLFVLQMAFGVFGTNPVSGLLTGVIAFLPKVFVAIVIVVVASAIAAGVKDVVGNALSGLSYGRIVANIASVSILVVGVFAALNQIEIAPAIVNGLFYAMLAVVVGSAIVAIGGGGIQPMRARWERTLQRIDDEAPRLREQLQSGGSQIDIDLTAVTEAAKAAEEVEETEETGTRERVTAGSGSRTTARANGSNGSTRRPRRAR